MSAVICKQKLLHKHEIVQLPHNYKFYDVDVEVTLESPSAKNAKRKEQLS